MKVISFKQHKQTKELSVIIDYSAEAIYDHIKDFKYKEKIKYFPKANMDIYMYQDEYNHYVDIISLKDTEDESEDKIIRIDKKRITCGILKYLLIHAEEFKLTDHDRDVLIGICFCF